jgi:hypothetical protein
MVVVQPVYTCTRVASILVYRKATTSASTWYIAESCRSTIIAVIVGTNSPRNAVTGGSSSSRVNANLVGTRGNRDSIVTAGKLVLISIC